MKIVGICQKSVNKTQNRKNEAVCGHRFVHKELLTPEERAASKVRVGLMIELTRARNERGLSQRKLEELSGVKQPVIARMEKGSTSPQLDTVIKVLAPLGKTLAVVPLDHKGIIKTPSQ